MQLKVGCPNFSSSSIGVASVTYPHYWIFHDISGDKILQNGDLFSRSGNPTRTLGLNWARREVLLSDSAEDFPQARHRGSSFWLGTECHLSDSAQMASAQPPFEIFLLVQRVSSLARHGWPPLRLGTECLFLGSAQPETPFSTRACSQARHRGPALGLDIEDNGGGLSFEVGGKIFVKTMVSEPFWVVPHTAQNGSDTIARLTL